MTEHSKFSSKTQIVLFIIYTCIFAVLLLNLIGAINFYAHPENVSSKQKRDYTTVYYTLDWQNQPGIPFTITNMSTYQFFDIHLVLISAFNFTQNSNITISAYGSMSSSLINTSLANIRIEYDGANPYPPNLSSIGGVGLILDVVPNGTAYIPGIALGDTVHVTSEPESMTWAFAGGPHYPTLSIQYWSGGNIIQEFSSAPIMIQASQPSQPSQDTPEQIAGNWVIGSIFIAIAEVIYLRFPRKKTAYVPLK